MKKILFALFCSLIGFNSLASNSVEENKKPIFTNANTSLSNDIKKPIEINNVTDNSKPVSVVPTKKQNIFQKLKSKIFSKPASGNTDILSLISFISGSLGLILLFFSPFGWILGLIGFILGIVALKMKTQNRLLAILGVVFGGISVLVLLIGLIFISALLASGSQL